MPKTKQKLTRAEKEVKLYNKRIGSIYQSMKTRMDGLRFPVATLREAMRPYLGTLCPFCRQPLRAKTFSIDHAHPVSRGGKKHLSNLQMICNGCNRAKSDLTHSEYKKLVIFLDTLGVDAYRSVIRRLKASPPWLR